MIRVAKPWNDALNQSHFQQSSLYCVISRAFGRAAFQA